MNQAPEKESIPPAKYTGSGLATGIALGVTLGAVFENVAIGIALGVALGAAADAFELRSTGKGHRERR
jgi:hypothetical protein